MEYFIKYQQHKTFFFYFQYDILLIILLHFNWSRILTALLLSLVYFRSHRGINIRHLATIPVCPLGLVDWSDWWTHQGSRAQPGLYRNLSVLNFKIKARKFIAEQLLHGYTLHRVLLMFSSRHLWSLMLKKWKEYFDILENTLSPFAFLQSYMFKFIDSCVFMLNMWPQTAAGELHLLIKDLQIPILHTTCVMRL